MTRIVLVLLALARTAAADSNDPRGMLAHFASTDVEHVEAAFGSRITGPGPWTHFVYGSYKSETFHHSMLVLLACTEKQCDGMPIWLDNTPFELRGLVDLDGKPAEFPSGRLDRARNDFNAELVTKGMRWPALVIEKLRDGPPVDDETIHGTKVRGSEHHHELVVVSLRRSEAKSPQIARLPTVDMYPTGAGATTSYKLDRGHRKTALDIVGTEQRHIESDLACIEPDPVIVTWVWSDGRYQRADLLERHGCH